ncbi:MAG: hypothetical protein ACRDB6_06865 [Cetobacterium sp.]
MKIFLILMLAFSSIASASLKDGKYTVISDGSIWFWYPYTEMVVKNGEVIEVIHDRIKKSGKKASQDKNYNTDMLKKVGVNPNIYSKMIPENYFKSGKNLEKMDSVAGATDSTDHFKKQMALLLEKASNEGPGSYVIKKSDL